MAFRRVLDQLRRPPARRPDNPADYSLLDTESDQLEKGDSNKLRRRLFSLRWLRKFRLLLPSFLHPSSPDAERKALRPTAWLDGLRGVAALFVVLHHMSLIWFSWTIHHGWASSSSSYSLVQFPILRLVITGPANVMLFFVISGYAISLKPLILLQDEQHIKVYQVLASSIFRRHPRLFIPAVIICSPAPLIAFLGGFDHEGPGGEEGGGGGMPDAAIKPMNPPRFDTFGKQLADYARTLMGLSDVYNPSGLNWVYSDSLWTLPIEFRSSLVVFGMLVALSRCTARARLAIATGVAVYSFWYFHWGEFLFIGGMLVVDLGLQWQRWRAGGDGDVDEVELGVELGPSHHVEPKTRACLAFLRTRTLGHLCATLGFMAGLFVLSMPQQGHGAGDSWGFMTLSAAIPTHFHDGGAADYFWQPLAAVFLVSVISSAGFLQSIFTTRIAQYLGRISFALYLVHMLILHSLGFWLGKRFLAFTGSEPAWRYGSGVAMAAVTVGCVIVYAADLGARFVDAKTVRFTAWAYAYLSRPT